MAHEPVLYHEIIAALDPQPGRSYVDGTVGAGGHAFGILDSSSPDGTLLGMDLDPQALVLSQEKLSPFQGRVTLVADSYTRMDVHFAKTGWESPMGILLDFGVSSMQLDTPARGFSFREDAPLDMRFNPEDEDQPTAADLVNTLLETELADLIYQFGEERKSRRIARAIVKGRPVNSTFALAEIIRKASSGPRSKIHPATRTFQALRIATNRELESVENVLPIAVDLLAPGGRLAVISFHSLEDRIVKQFFRRESKDCICPSELPVCICDHTASLKEVTRKPLQASGEEILNNPRSRSAKLRIAEKILSVH